MTKSAYLGLVFIFAICGCETYRYEYVPSIDSVLHVERRYSLKECVSYYAFGSGYDRREHRDTFQSESFSRDELGEMMRMYPEVFSDDGIPVSIKLSRDMDRSESCSLCAALSGIFYLCTIGIVPGVFANDNCVVVSLTIGKTGAPTSGFEIKESKRQTCATSGLNLLFPYSSPLPSEFSQSGSANLFSSGERRSWSIGMGVDSRCRKAAYAYAIAAALAEHERRGFNETRSSRRPGMGELGGGRSANGATESGGKAVESRNSQADGSSVIEIEQIPL